MVRWTRACASLLVVFGLLTSILAACAEGATASATAQMGCCKAGHHHCPMKGSASDCCKKSGPRFEFQTTLAKAISIVAPVSVPVAWVALLPSPSVAETRHRIATDRSPPGHSPGPPIYIAVSSLLI